jgi:hypothetical protein
MQPVTAPSFRVPASELPAWLAGDWSVERDINAGRGAFAGTATFTEQPDGTLRWSEDGTMRLDAFTGPATRVLVVHPATPWEVRFDDGNPFHPLDLAEGACTVEHLCGPDIYRGVYDPISADELVVRWAISGPGRDDTIVSRYQRLP